MAKKLFLLDAYALVYRAHFVFIRNPRLTTGGMNTSAIYGFLNSLIEVLNKEKPDYLGVAFDLSAPTFRHEMYPEYKAQREETPEDIKQAIPIIKRLLAAMNIPMLEKEGFEADDVIGTIAWKASDAGVDTYMLTPDKDYAQLVRDNVFMFRPKSKGGGHEVYDIEKVKEKIGVRPDQVADYLGLKGDSVDNIPGVPKVGEKTAISLLEEFDNMENLLANIENVSKKAIKASLEAHREQAELSKTLAIIKTDVPVDLDLDHLKCEPFDADKVLPIFEELEFKSLAKRLFDAEITVGGEEEQIKSIDDVKTDYQLVDDAKSRKALIEQLVKQEHFCFDTETGSLDVHQADLVGLAFSFKATTGYYVPIPADRDEALAILDEFARVWTCNAIKIAHNLKYDLLVLRSYGIEIVGPFYDTMLAHYVLQADGKHGMDVLARQYLNYDPMPISVLIGKKGKNQKSMRDIDIPIAAKYAAEDADVTLQLYERFTGELDKDGKLKTLLDTVDLPLVPVLVRMERNGIRIDKAFLDDYSAELQKEIDALEKQAIDEANTQYRRLDDTEKEDEGMFGGQAISFNIASPKQLGEILFDKLKLPGGKRTKSGQYKTDEQTLSSLAADGHRLPELVLEYRSLSKLRSTYVHALPELINAESGLIHTSYNQAVAVTGRLSSNNPNLQNIPIRTAAGRKVRRAFIPRDESYTLLAADYSQIELRIMAALSQDETMMSAFANQDDIHSLTAARVFGVDESEVSREQRSKAKMVNFGMIYGITPFGLAQRLGIPNGEAREIHEAFFRQFPDIKNYMDYCVEKAQKEGYAETLLGRRHYLRDIKSNNRTVRGIAERNAINTPVQGTAADLIKLAMIELDKNMRGEGFESKLLLQVHDELVFDAKIAELDALKPVVEAAMTGAMDLKGVPLEVEMDTGDNWLDAH